MSQPYKRVLYLHGALLGGGILAMALGAPAIMLAVLVALKIGVDVWAHIRAHKPVAPRIAGEQQV